MWVKILEILLEDILIIHRKYSISGIFRYTIFRKNTESLKTYVPREQFKRILKISGIQVISCFTNSRKWELLVYSSNVLFARTNKSQEISPPVLKMDALRFGRMIKKKILVCVRGSEDRTGQRSSCDSHMALLSFILLCKHDHLLAVALRNF